MSKKLTIASAILAASTAFAFETWLGSEELPQVNTGLGNDTETAGYWFAYNDKDDGGNSKVEWGGPVGTDDSDEALDRVIQACKGVCGTAVLDKGKLAYNPFVGIGFNVVGETSPTNKTPEAGNATSWGGLCITYKVETEASLELGLGGTVDASIGFANPAATLAKSTVGTKKVFAWSDFKQPKWYTGDEKKDGPTAAAKLVAVKFKIQAVTGPYEFNIMAIGPYDGTCPGTDAIKSVRAASSVKALVSGRTLGITGLKTSAAVEVLNLQGQVVAKGLVEGSSSLDLAALDAGVYMVRVAGKSVNFSNKVVLKLFSDSRTLFLKGRFGGPFLRFVTEKVIFFFRPFAKSYIYIY